MIKIAKRLSHHCFSDSRLVISLATIIGIALIFIPFFFSINVQNGSSMEPVINHKDLFLSTKLVGPPAFSDVVVFFPNSKKGGSFCMRIVGTPGDRIHWDFGILHRNSDPLGSLELHFSNVQSKDVKIPQNSYFLIGDNYGNSKSSFEFGTIPNDMMYGRAVFNITQFCRIR